MDIIYNKLKFKTKNYLAKVNQEMWRHWARTHYIDSKHSRMDDLPSSQMPSKKSLIRTDYAQLFVVIDTCTIVGYQNNFIQFLIDQKQLFDRDSLPIRFIISLPVLEELDKHNRRRGKQSNTEAITKSENINNNNQINQDLIELSNKKCEPPRYLNRIIEEEVRINCVLISELDPFKETKLSVQFEIINADDRIIECCLRSRKFIEDLPHHPGTKVILVTEDNVFKSKATNYGIPSFRWLEFEVKYKNFGLENCAPTPLIQPNLNKLTVRNNVNGRKIKSDGNKVRKRDGNEDDDDVKILKEVIIINLS